MPFTKAPWESPESKLDAAEFCAVCLIDENEPGVEKVKARCMLPVRSSRGAPYNLNGLAAAAGRLNQTEASTASKRAAARKLIRLYREAGQIAPARVYSILGEKQPLS
jgi:hypothetical protein